MACFAVQTFAGNETKFPPGSSLVVAEKLLGFNFMYGPEGISIVALATKGSLIVKKFFSLTSFSKTVVNTQLDNDPSLSRFTISLSPAFTFCAFSPSNKKYTAFPSGSS